LNTTNYGLYLTDDSSERFQEWRSKINGTTDSNMLKIDAALGQKADSSTSIEAVLLASAWVGSSAPYTQDISVNGLTADHNGSISISQSATTMQRDAARKAVLLVSGQEDNKLTISADGGMPDVDIPVCIILLG
jgi:hypothetical protein